MGSGDVAEWVSDLVVECHGRHDPFVGGLFNAYEKAVHYELLTRLYQRGVWRAECERPIPGTGGKCDLVIPLDEGGRLWLEVKLWWFFLGPTVRAWTMERAKTWPVGDWEKLERCNGRRAVMLVRMWDDPGRTQADRFLADLKPSMTARGAPEPLRRELREFTYPAPLNYTACGDVHTWVSP